MMITVKMITSVHSYKLTIFLCVVELLLYFNLQMDIPDRFGFMTQDQTENAQIKQSSKRTLI